MLMELFILVFCLVIVIHTYVVFMIFVIIDIGPLGQTGQGSSGASVIDAVRRPLQSSSDSDSSPLLFPSCDCLDGYQPIPEPLR